MNPTKDYLFGLMEDFDTAEKSLNRFWPKWAVCPSCKNKAKQNSIDKTKYKYKCGCGHQFEDSIRQSYKDFFKIYNTEEKCRKYIESCRWPNGAMCPYQNTCPRVEYCKDKTAYSLNNGAYQTKHCGRQFTVKTETFMGASKLPLKSWLETAFLVLNANRGMTADMLNTILGTKQPRLWFMAQRIFNIVKIDDWKVGGVGKIVAIDETFIGGKAKNKHKDKKKKYTKVSDKIAVLGFIEYDGNAIFRRIKNCKIESIEPFIEKHVLPGTFVFTDERKAYESIFKMKKYKDKGYKHDSVKHKDKQYAKESEVVKGVWVTTNKIENMFSVLKKTINGMHNIVGDEHMERYANMYSFRRSVSDLSPYEKMEKLFSQIDDTRLTYDEATNFLKSLTLIADDKTYLRRVLDLPKRGKLSRDTKIAIREKIDPKEETKTERLARERAERKVNRLELKEKKAKYNEMVRLANGSGDPIKRYEEFCEILKEFYKRFGELPSEFRRN